MPERQLRWFPLLVPGIASLVIGCGGYTSEYVPPPDGRPRLVWQKDRVVAMQSNPVPSDCNADADALAHGYAGAPGLQDSVRVVRTGSGGGVFWVPVHHVRVVHVGGPILAPIPRPIIPITGGSVGGVSGGGIGNIGGGGGGGSGDLGKAAIVVAVLAIVVLPFIALGLAVGRPEPERDVAIAIDRVNAQTDLARTPGSSCDELVVAGEVAQ